MKSFCIKTNNEEIIEYLLNKISKIDYLNIYYCNKTLKKYQNIILHYREDEVDKFINVVTNIIIDTIINFYQEGIIKRLINVNYFYFDEFEKNIIYDNCEEFLEQEMEDLFETIFLEIKKYLETNRNIVLEGVVNFRISGYVKILDNIVDMAVNKYIIEKEYKEFINLLKIFINTTNPKSEILHLIYINGESILLDKNKNIIQLKDKIDNMKYLSDISFSSNDLALNTLLSMLPKEIDIHIIDKEDDFINTLKLIFENRIKICTDCNICRTYKILQCGQKNIYK